MMVSYLPTPKRHPLHRITSEQYISMLEIGYEFQALSFLDPAPVGVKLVLVNRGHELPALYKMITKEPN